MTDWGWDRVAYLDALRPEAGWRVDHALLATYSLDLVALVAVLLSLAGLDDDRGFGSKVDFANALEELRGRARVLVQSGRVAAPAGAPKVMAVLDQFVREVGMDESQGSWHPKVALVRMVAARDDAGIQWRLWLGSRNLTRDLSWDTGLTLVGEPGAAGDIIPGVADLGRDLADRAELAGLTGQQAWEELDAVRWQRPAGFTVEEVSLLTGGARPLPEAPEGLRKLTVISPFLDGGVVGELGRWGDARTRRVLLSTLTELTRLAAQKGRPLEGFHELLSLDAPPRDLESPAEGVADAASDDEEPDPQGLHAKVICADASSGRWIWTGSPNATGRGWKGPNVEASARLNVKRAVAEGLESWVKQVGRTVDVASLGEPQVDETENRLDEARRQVVTRWQVEEKIRADGVQLVGDAAPHPDDPSIALDVGVLGHPVCPWPRGSQQVVLPRVAAGEATEFVVCRVSLGELKREWIQLTPMDPPPSVDRDRQALARYLDWRSFLSWIRSILSDDGPFDGAESWDTPGSGGGSRSADSGPNWLAPTLEEVLKAWAKDPETLVSAHRKIQGYLQYLDEEAERSWSAEDRAELEAFRGTWNVVYGGLVEARP